jgi:hypothetical protein
MIWIPDSIGSLSVYSITSSARPSRAVGIVMPSAFSGVFSEQEEEEDCKLHFDFGEFLIE